MLFALTGLSGLCFVSCSGADTKNSLAAIDTSMGNIVVELHPKQSPNTVKNFLRYVDEEFYDGVIFHRIVKGFMIQTGLYLPGLQPKEPHGDIKNEADNGLSNLRGTVAMARFPEPHTASSQFFINLVDNTYLDHRNKTDAGYGYCVFGRVIEGMDVVDRIAQVRTGVKSGVPDVPIQNVTIKTVRRVQE